MGNQPSAQRPHSTAASSSSGLSESPRTHSRRESKPPIVPVNIHSRTSTGGSSDLGQGQAPSRPPQNNTTSTANNRPIPPQQVPGAVAASPRTAETAQPGNGRPAPAPVSDEPSKPVAVPCSSHHAQQQQVAHLGKPPSSEPAGSGVAGTAGIVAGALLETEAAGSLIMPISSVQDMSYMTRPPRLPLPIEEEIHTPGSPIISPEEIAGSPVGQLDQLDSEETLGRKHSTLSRGDDDEYDAEELRVDKTRPTVPFRLEWPNGGEKVYVTGTIFQWNRKHRLHPVEGRPGVFAATINILPGTHHVRFLVDGQMQTSPDLPTTVDFGNNLVNYIEVSAATPEENAVASSGASQTAASTKSEASSTTSGAEQQQQRQKQHLNQDDLSQSGGPGSSQIDPKTVRRYKDIIPADKFEYDIPKYLVDFDQPEESPLYHVSVSAIEKLPNPPILPGFLGKPILNAAVLIKDDNSVLNMPNHTVLNHLATSSIKNNILAVSATTRYKSKYVTTIIYKPTSHDG